MKVSMIAALDRNRVIGTGDGRIPWSLPRDVEHFREYTKGKHLLVGRKTLEEMKGWFNGRTPVVLTHSRDYQPEEGRVAHSVEEAVTEAFEDGAEELVVIGGARAYEAALPFADELILTHIHTRAEVDIDEAARFPDYEAEIEWEETARESFPPDDENAFAMEVTTLRRVKPSSLRPGRLHLL